MTSGTEFSVATVDDLPRVVELKFAMFAEAGRASLLPPGSAKTILTDYQRLYNEGLARHFVVRTSAGVVACVGAFLKTDLPFRYFEPPRYGFIGDVYTDPAHRGHGYSTELNREALQWLRSEGVKMVRLLASDAGRSLYVKLGFEPSDEMVLTYAI